MYTCIYSHILIKEEPLGPVFIPILSYSLSKCDKSQVYVNVKHVHRHFVILKQILHIIVLPWQVVLCFERSTNIKCTLISQSYKRSVLQLKTIAAVSIFILREHRLRGVHSAFRLKRCSTMLLPQSVLYIVYISICFKSKKLTIASKAVRYVQSTLFEQ